MNTSYDDQVNMVDDHALDDHLTGKFSYLISLFYICSNDYQMFSKNRFDYVNPYKSILNKKNTGFKTMYKIFYRKEHKNSTT